MLGLTIFTSLLALGLTQITGEGPCAGQIYGDLIPDPKNCSNFYQCVSATEYLRNCPKGLHFDCAAKTCTWPLQAQCQLNGGTCNVAPTATPSSTTSTSTTTTTQSSAIEAPCQSMDPETYGDPEDCTMYTYCYKGKPSIVKCPIGEFYSKEDNACIETEECPATATTTPATTTPEQPVIIPPCSTLDPETHADPNDCMKYTYCENGMPYVVQCAIGEYYSASDNACIEANECPASATTTSSPPITTTPKPVVKPPCTSFETETKEDPMDCTRYYYCHAGIPYHVQCAVGMYYSQEHNGCISASECPAGSGVPTTTTTTSKPTEPPIVPPCTSLNTEVVEDPDDCTQYYYCHSGYPFIVKCPLGSYYSAVEKACVKADQCPKDITTTTTTTTTTPIPIEPPCQSLNPETYPDPDDCTKFTYCIMGKPFLVQCEKGYYFNPATNGCIKADQCPSATTTTSTTTTTPNPIEPPCQSLNPEAYPDPDDCTKFTYCINGKPYPIQCPDGYYFNPATNGCIKTDVCPSATTTTSTTTTTTTTPNPIEPPCQSLNPETYPDQDDCTKFTYCVNGKPYPIQCPDGYYYDKSFAGCVKADQCPSATTTSSTTTTTTTTSTTTTTTESPIRPPCTSMEMETHPVPEDCTKFIYCFLGYPLVVQCEKGYYYSAAQNSCVAAASCPQNILNLFLY